MLILKKKKTIVQLLSCSVLLNYFWLLVVCGMVGSCLGVDFIELDDKFKEGLVLLLKCSRPGNVFSSLNLKCYFCIIFLCI